MELPKYTGTIHPEEWLKQIQTYCTLKEIENEQKILKICKLLIDSIITIPDEINSFDELIKALKSHSSLKFLKVHAKKITMKFFPRREKNYIASSLCNDAEINDPEEIKNFLMYI